MLMLLRGKSLPVEKGKYKYEIEKGKEDPCGAGLKVKVLVCSHDF